MNINKKSKSAINKLKIDKINFINVENEFDLEQEVKNFDIKKHIYFNSNFNDYGMTFYITNNLLIKKGILYLFYDNSRFRKLDDIDEEGKEEFLTNCFHILFELSILKASLKYDNNLMDDVEDLIIKKETLLKGVLENVK